MRDSVVASCEQSSIETLATVDSEDQADTIYAIDRLSEDVMLEWFEAELAPLGCLELIAEGLPEGLVLGGSKPQWTVIVDPIDGTRGLMYQKRSAWVLTGVAPYRASGNTLSDIELAVQTEIPLLKQHLCDVLWAIKGRGAWAQRFDRLSGTSQAFVPRPSKATDLEHGYAQFVRALPRRTRNAGALGRWLDDTARTARWRRAEH